MGVFYGAIDPGRDKKSPCCPARAAAAGKKLRVAAAQTAVQLQPQQDDHCAHSTLKYINICVCECEGDDKLSFCSVTQFRDKLKMSDLGQRSEVRGQSRPVRVEQLCDK